MLTKSSITTILSTIFLMIFSATLLTSCSTTVMADVSNCKPVTKPHKRAKVLDAETSKIVAKTARINTDQVAVIFVVDRDGKIKALTPTNATTSKAKRCNFKFPLKAGTLKNMDTINLFVTTNPKVCWRDSTGTDQCVVW